MGGLQFVLFTTLNQIHLLILKESPPELPTVGNVALKEVTKLVESYQRLVGEVGCTTAQEALKEIKTLRTENKELREQNLALVQILGCDNWYNAVSRARKLLKEELT